MKAYRTRSRPPRASLALQAGLTAVALATAALAQAPQPPHNPADTAGLAPAGRPAPQAGGTSDQRAALVGNTPILWDDLRPAMAELAGGQALQEAILDRALAEQLRARNLTVTTEDIAAEQSLLTASIARDAKTAAADAERLLDQVRRSRGLGESRFASLLRRTAAMRKLVADSVTVSDEEVKQSFDISHGPRYRARLILVSGQRDAAEIRATLLDIRPDTPPPPPPPADILAFRFSDAASRLSIDPSSSRGGLLEPISPSDPAYPASARQALAQLTPGEVSPVIAVDRNFALLMLQEQIPPDGAKLDELAPAIRAEVRKRRERLAMDELARRTLRAANPTILDRDLDWSWRNALPLLAVGRWRRKPGAPRIKPRPHTLFTPHRAV